MTPATLAVATPSGVFTSRNSGESFKPIATAIQGMAVFFDFDGKDLWYGTFDGAARLARIAIAGGTAASVKLPPLGRDAVAYIAQNPARRSEYGRTSALGR
jgi:hypothetical protein